MGTKTATSLSLLPFVGAKTGKGVDGFTYRKLAMPSCLSMPGRRGGARLGGCLPQSALSRLGAVWLQADLPACLCLSLPTCQWMLYHFLVGCWEEEAMWCHKKPSAVFWHM